MSYVLEELRDTVAVRWRRDQVGHESLPSRHWKTRLSYYEAIDELLAATPGQTPAWHVIVEKAHGSKSTFFEMTGTGTRNRPALREAYAMALGPARDLADRMDRDTKPELLIDETKVWNYWPHRTGWMHQLSNFDNLDRSAVTETLLLLLLDWAERQPHLAAVHDYAPPVCAIEDFMIIRRGEVLTAEAVAVLRDAIHKKIAPPGCSTEGVLHAFRERYRPKQQPIPPQQELAAVIERVLGYGEDAAVRQEAIALMREAIRVLESVDGDHFGTHRE